MSKYDINEPLNVWEDGLNNSRKRKQEWIDSLIEKYGFPVREENLLKEDFALHDMVKDDLAKMEKDYYAYQSQPRGSSLDDEDMKRNAEKLKEQNPYATSSTQTSTANNNAEDEQAAALKKIREQSSKKEIKPLPKREDTWIDKAAEIIATSDVARKAALAMQGAADSYINPVGLALRFKNYIQNGEFSTGIEHIEPKDGFEKMIELAGEMLYEAGPALKAFKAGKTATTTAINKYEQQQFGQAYKKVYNELLEKAPGDAEEIMATVHKLFGKSTHIQRGAAAYTTDGKLITQGKELLRATNGATKRNYGLTKEIGLHNMSEADVKALPELLRKNDPVEVTDSGRWVYEVVAKDGRTRKVVTALKEINGKLRRVVISDYWLDDIKTPIRKLVK